jgi:hypothetical protein
VFSLARKETVLVSDNLAWGSSHDRGPIVLWVKGSLAVLETCDGAGFHSKIVIDPALYVVMKTAWLNNMRYAFGMQGSECLFCLFV